MEEVLSQMKTGKDRGMKIGRTNKKVEKEYGRKKK
jgi:hypothetical protein